MMIEAFCDGGARGNPGPAAFGYVIKKDGQIIKSGNGYIGIATNNVAEYTGVIEALTWLESSYPKVSLTFYLDSKLVASQLLGIYKVKNANIRNLVFKIRTLESNFGQVNYKHIPREKNKDADRLVNLVFDGQLGN